MLNTKTACASLLFIIGCNVPSADDAEIASLAFMSSVETAHGYPDIAHFGRLGLSPPVKSVLKRYVIGVAEANTEERGNEKEVRRALAPAIALLAIDFAHHRPENELDLTRGAWKSLWYDSESIDPPPPIALDRGNIYQVVEEDYYYNVAIQALPGPDGGVSDTQYFLRGNYEIARPASTGNRRQFALNVIDLEFAESVFRPGRLPTDRPLVELVDEVNGWVENGFGPGIPPISVPGPAGQTGYLFNLFIDDELRIAGGIDNEDPSQDLSLFILRRTETASATQEWF